MVALRELSMFELEEIVLATQLTAIPEDHITRRIASMRCEDFSLTFLIGLAISAAVELVYRSRLKYKLS